MTRRRSRARSSRKARDTPRPAPLEIPPGAFVFPLHEKQLRALDSPATELLYGGAAGSGKSHLLRVAAIAWAHHIPGLQVFLFRRTFPELVRNHLNTSNGFHELLAPHTDRGLVRFILSGEDPRIAFSHGSIIHLCHCQHEEDRYRHRGSEIHALLFDELTTFPESIYLFLRGRVRRAGIDFPPGFEDRFPRVLAGTNPGDIGHSWVRSTWIDPAPPFEVWRASQSDGGMLRQYVPAVLEDNPSIDTAEYESKLEGLGDSELIKALRHGLWDIAPGAFFSDVWNPDRHVLDPFEIPRGWRKFRAFDWGSAKPATLQHWAESDGTQPNGGACTAGGHRVHIPRGSLVMWGEWHVCDEKRPERGLRLSNQELGAGIAGRGAGHRFRGCVADPSIFTEMGGPSIYRQMLEGAQRWAERAGEKRHGIAFGEADNNRVAGWQRVRHFLRSALADHPEEPGLWVFAQCRALIRTIGTIPRSDRQLDDVDTNADDHACDALRYACQSTATKSRRRKRGDDEKPAKLPTSIATELERVTDAAW